MEHVNFKGAVNTKESGEDLTSFDMDFAEAWPETIRMRKVLSGTLAYDMDLGPVTTAKIVAVRSDASVYLIVQHNTSASDHRWECRGNCVAQVNSTHVWLEGVGAGPTEVFLYVAGI